MRARTQSYWSASAITFPLPGGLGPVFDNAHADPTLERLLRENAQRDLLFRTVFARLTSGSRPVLLIIEDAQWADAATLDLLFYLGRRIASTRGFCVVTYRDEEIGARHPLRRLLGDLAIATVHRLTVPPITADAVTSLAVANGVDPDVLYARTDGNPFFVTEILAAGGEIPATVRDAVLARASRLGHGAWILLEATAVIGTPIEFELLGHMNPRNRGVPEPADDSQRMTVRLAALLSLWVLRAGIPRAGSTTSTGWPS